MKKKCIPEEMSLSVKTKRKCMLFFLGELVAIAVMILICTNLGSADIGTGVTAKVIFGKITGNETFYADVPRGIAAIIWDIRLPRVICGVFVGAGLSVSGAVFQGLLRNPLADPYTLGISTGAALGASIAIFLSGILAILDVPVLPCAFAGAIITLFIVTQISKSSGNINSNNLVIAGIIVSSILSAGISFIKNAAGEEVGAIVFWIMGSLSARTWTHVVVLVPVVFICTFVCIYYSDELNILCTGDDYAKMLGVNVNRVRKILLVAASLITASCVASSGVIGFVGLVIPHLLRFGLTSDNKHLLPLCACSGAILLTLADNMSRVLFPSEIPVGVLTTLVGGPFFIFLFMNKGKKKGVTV